jgi:hypothetical protein
MSDAPNPSDDADQAKLPRKLGADLKSLFGPMSISPADDQEILHVARMKLARRRRTRRMFVGAGMGFLIAAMLLIAIPLFRAQTKPLVSPSQFALGAAPSGKPVDILTAYRLAHALQLGVKPTPDWDRNGDGRVDQSDVDALAAAAVSLQGGTAQ